MNYSQVEVCQIVEEMVGFAGFEMAGGRDSGADGDGLDAIFFGGADILGGVADEGDSGVGGDAVLGAGAFDGEFCEAASRRRHFPEGTVGETSAKPGSFEFPPADPGDIAGDEGQRGALGSEGVEEFGDARAVAVGEFGGVLEVEILSGADEFRHVGGYFAVVRSDGAEHEGQDIGVEHAVDRDALGSAFHAEDASDGLAEGLPVPEAGFAD